MKKIPIYFNKSAFDNATEIFQQKTSIIKQINSEFKKLLKTDDTLIIDYSDLKKDFLSKLTEQKKEVNSLNLSGDKLAELLNLDTTHLDQLQTEIRSVILSSEPSKDNFTTFAETDAEIEKFKLCAEIIKTAITAHETIKKLRPADMRNYLLPFAPLIMWDPNESKLMPSHTFIKNSSNV